MPNRELKIAWIGPTNDELNWLRQRVEQAGLLYGRPTRHTVLPTWQARQTTSFTHAISTSAASAASVARSTTTSTAISTQTSVEPSSALPVQAEYSPDDWAVLEDADRIVVHWLTRAGYPWRALEALESRAWIAPWAVATSSWIDGSRRTGIGAANHFQLPWYRWWEAWHGWFFPEHARLGSLSNAHFAPVVSPVDWARPSPSTAQTTSNCSRRLAIVARCVETQAAWQSMAEHAGWTTTTARDIDQLLQSQVLQSQVLPSPVIPSSWNCLLIDDSVLAILATEQSTMRPVARPAMRLHGSGSSSGSGSGATHSRFVDALAPLVARCRLSCTGYPIVMALGREHLADWRELRSIGVDDFLIKPSFGLPLADYLYSLSSVGA